MDLFIMQISMEFSCVTHTGKHLEKHNTPLVSSSMWLGLLHESNPATDNGLLLK